MTNYRNITMKDAGQQCYGVYWDDDLVARIVPHDTAEGWKIVDLDGKALTKQPYETPELALKYLPHDLPKRRDER